MTNLPVWLDALLTFLYEIGRFLLQALLVVGPCLLWFIYSLRGINWAKMWPTLREGAWVPLVLLLVLVALVWSQIRPSDITLFGVMTMGNFWWQLGAATLFAALGLFAGWLQDRYGWYPQEIAVAPPAHADHGHDHGHGQHH